MNETRDLIIGIDFGKEYSQICYYDRKADEPRSLPVKVAAASLRCQPVSVDDWSRGIIALVWKQSTLPEKKADF